MRYLDATVGQFVNYIKDTHKKIILFGSGAVCKTFVPYIAKKHGISGSITCIVDNHPAKQGSHFSFDGNRVPVVGPEIFRSLPDGHCVLITNGDFYSVTGQLDGIRECAGMDCFLAAFMQLGREYDRKQHKVFADFDSPQIPKIIHCCWFSGNPMPAGLAAYINTWKELCPDYDIICWNEKNYDVTKHRYTREAHGRKKWGYIPDIVRLEKLHECGGFYFDTDVRMVRNLDPLRYEEAFCSRERAGHVNFGGGSGCVKGSSIVRKILDYRIDEPFDLGNGMFNGEASGYYESAPLMELGLEIEDTNQKLEGINVYASEFFSPYNYINGENIRNDNTFSIHCFQGSWTEDGNAARKETREQYEGFRARMEKVSSQRESRSKARKGPAF